ncbi:MAG: flavin reductase family protein, partial [Thermaceae bacterium]
GTVNWVTQASFTPPLLALGVKRDSRLYALLRETGVLGLNVLAHDQKSIAQDFFKPTQREGDRLNGHPFEPGPKTGVPLLTELPYWLEAQVVEVVERGDHAVVVAEVVEAGVRYEAKPLVMWETGWFYGG